MPAPGDVIHFDSNSVWVFEHDRVIAGGESILAGSVDKGRAKALGEFENFVDMFSLARTKTEIMMKTDRR